MALTLPWLWAAVVSVSGALAPDLPAATVERVVAGLVNRTGVALAARRGVPAGRPLAVKLVDRPHMRAAVAATRRTTRSPDEATDEAVLQGLLGLHRPWAVGPTSAGAPPVSPVASGGSGNGNGNSRAGRGGGETAGLYDVTGKRLLVASWNDLGAGAFALDRDIAQALLDRRFDLAHWLVPGARRLGDAATDGDVARQAVVEGDAAVQALEHRDPQGNLPPPRALAEILADVRETVVAESASASPWDLGRRLFVSLDGLMFIARLREREPWRRIDEVWRRPPQSSEQVLHPEKYLRHEAPDDVRARLPTQVRGGWRSTYGDTLGELGVALFLGRTSGPYRAERAAAGWGGDRALLLRRFGPRGATGEPPGTLFAAWVTTWDDDSDAEDFAREAGAALAALAGTRGEDDAGAAAAGKLRVTDGWNRVYLVERRRRMVGLLFAAPADGEAALSELMSAAGGRPLRRARGHHGTRARSR